MVREALSRVFELATGLTAQERVALRHGWRASFRRVFAEGPGAFVITVLLAALGLAFLRAWYLVDTRYDQILLERIYALLDTEQRPSGEHQKQMGMLAAVLTPVNSPMPCTSGAGEADRPGRADCSSAIECCSDRESPPCPEADPACRAAQSIHRNFGALARWSLADPSAIVPSASQALSNLLETSKPRAFAIVVTAAADVVRRKLHPEAGAEEEDRAAAATLPLHECPFPKPILDRQRAIAFGRAGCLREPDLLDTHLIVPALQYQSFEQDRGSRLHRRIRDAIALSDLLGPTVALSLPKERTPEEGLELVQVYFISVDSVFRIWTRNPVSEELFTPTRLWATASYFQEFLRDDELGLHPTPAYLDYGGYGVVRTICSAIDKPTTRSVHTRGISAERARTTEGAPRGHPNVDSHALVDLDTIFAPLHRREIVGILCTDLRLPPHTVAARIDESPFLRVYVASFTTGSGERDVILERPSEPGGSGVAEDSTTTEFRRALLDAFHDNRLATNRMTRIPNLVHEKSRAYFLPMESGAKRPKRGLLVVPMTPETPFNARAALSLFALLCFLGGVGGAYSVTRTRRSNEHGRWIDLLRNLPEGFVETNGDEQVVLANDRAEEILNMTLPKTLRDPLGPNVRDDLIEPWVMEIDASGGIGRVVGFSSIPQLRAQEESSSYYARLRNPPPRARATAWIKVSASPILLAAPPARRPWRRPLRSGSPRTFGIVESVSRKKAKRLDTLLEAHLSR